MNALINDLLAFHKLDAEKSKIEAVDLNELIQEVQASFQYDLKEEALEFKVNKLPVIHGHKHLLKTLFQNLISNSIKFQPKNKAKHRPKVSISAREYPSEIHLFVSDNGIGVKKEHIASLFEPFSRFHSHTKYKGTGLGMSICKRVMEKHGGQIIVEETSSKGTVIKLVFLK